MERSLNAIFNTARRCMTVNLSTHLIMIPLKPEYQYDSLTIRIEKDVLKFVLNKLENKRHSYESSFNLLKWNNHEIYVNLYSEVELREAFKSISDTLSYDDIINNMKQAFYKRFKFYTYSPKKDKEEYAKNNLKVYRYLANTYNEKHTLFADLMQDLREEKYLEFINDVKTLTIQIDPQLGCFVFDSIEHFKGKPRRSETIWVDTKVSDLQIYNRIQNESSLLREVVDDYIFSTSKMTSTAK